LLCYQHWFLLFLSKHLIVRFGSLD
jgi:hypothetical protein